MEQPMQPAQPAAPAQGQPTAPAQGQLPAPNPETMSPVVLSHMDELEQMREMMDGQLGDAYDRVLTAGMKMMYSPQSAEVTQKLIMDDNIPLPNKLGEGVANLIVMMDNQGNGTIPKEVLAPVGIALLFEATDYLFELGIEATEEDLGKAIELMIMGIFAGFGIEMAQVDKMVDDLGAKLGFDETKVTKAAAPAQAAKEGAAFEQGFAADQAARKGV